MFQHTTKETSYQTIDGSPKFFQLIFDTVDYFCEIGKPISDEK